MNSGGLGLGEIWFSGILGGVLPGHGDREAIGQRRTHSLLGAVFWSDLIGIVLRLFLRSVQFFATSRVVSASPAGASTRISKP
jgi:hypothetical protein